MSAHQFNNFALQVASLYLGYGGSSSRIESALKSAARSLNYQTEILASPSGIYITTSETEGDKPPLTELRRVRDRGIQLSILSDLEWVVKQLIENKIDLLRAITLLETIQSRSQVYPMCFKLLSAWVIGFTTGFAYQGDWRVGLTAGFITLFVALFATKISRRLAITGIFVDFLSCFLMLLSAGAISRFMKMAPEPLVIGGFLYLVPGVTIFTAVSELATFNFLSGTAKFMKGILIVSAMVLSFILAQSLGGFIPQDGNIDSIKTHSVWSLFSHVIINTMAFSVILTVPLRALIGAIVTGAIGFVTFYFVSQEASLVPATYIASTMVGLMSLLFSFLSKVPSQCFSVPGIMSLLPGLLALKSFRILSAGMTDTGFSTFFQAILVAIAIVFGLITARIPFSSFSTFKEDQ